MLFIQYPKCSTCQNAAKWLEKYGVAYKSRNITEENPTKEELEKWVKLSGYPIKKFFNTSGLKYKELKLKERLETMTHEEKLELLASDGMLVKRPLIIAENIILIGFKEEEWKTALALI